MTSAQLWSSGDMYILAHIGLVHFAHEYNQSMPYHQVIKTIHYWHMAYMYIATLI